jgi:hypothetical protein
VKTGKTTGYYVDIFRSRKQRKGDKFHDYYYHNLGQSMQVMDISGSPLKLTPSEQLAFAGGHLYALDYMWDKNSLRTNYDYQVEWEIDMPDGQDDVFMNLWMKGAEGREVFSIKSPPNKAFRGGGGLPYDVDKAPYLTFAARQHGEAWEHPFVSVYEPFTSNSGKSVASISGFNDENDNPEFVGVKVIHKSGREDLVFSTKNGEVARYREVSTDASYALVSNETNEDFVLFMGNGKLLNAHGYSVTSNQKGNVVLEKKDGKLLLHNEVPVVITFDNTQSEFDTGENREVNL